MRFQVAAMVVGMRGGVIAPEPCADAAQPIKDTVELAVDVQRDRATLGLSKVNEIEHVDGGLAKLESKLADQKASAFFADRTDLTFTLYSGATLTELFGVLEMMHRAGFARARWVAAAAQLPARLD